MAEIKLGGLTVRDPLPGDTALTMGADGTLALVSIVSSGEVVAPAPTYKNTITINNIEVL